MVVLSVGLNPPVDVSELAKKFGIELSDHGFCKLNEVNPMETNRPGIFVSGGFQGPVDIPESVFSASGAGSQIGELLDYRRGNLTKERIYPEERDVSQEEPKVGVFVCHCGANISGVVNVPDTVEYCKTLPNVVHAQNQVFSCATNSAKEITDLAKEKGLNRVVVAACSPRTLEPLFRDTLREAGINQYYYEMANIREHCSWVHSEREGRGHRQGTGHHPHVGRPGLPSGALPGIRSARRQEGARGRRRHRRHDVPPSPSPTRGMRSTWSRKRKTSGESPEKSITPWKGWTFRPICAILQARSIRHPPIHVYTDATITAATGYVGNFVTTVKSDRGITEIKHGAAVIAIGADVYTPTEYLYGQDERVMTHLELEEKIAAEDEKVLNAQSLVMIQCVGCRNEERNYCSRICCSESVKNALLLKERNPKMDIYILFRDVRTYGFKEDYYREAASKGVRFIRYEPEDPPLVEPGEAEDGRPVLKVTATDYILGKKLELDADIIALAAAVIPSAATKEVAGQFKVTLSPDGFFKEAHVKLRPVEFATDGVYLCGLAHYPKFMQETINQSYGAAGRVLTLLSHDTVVASGSVCEVDENKCVSCGACITACTYGAIEFYETPQGRKARVNPVLCKGDGLCNTKCATNAIIAQALYR